MNKNNLKSMMSQITLKTYYVTANNDGSYSILRLLSEKTLDPSMFTKSDFDLPEAESHETIAANVHMTSCDSDTTITFEVSENERCTVVAERSVDKCIQIGRSDANTIVFNPSTVPRYAMRICYDSIQNKYYVKAAGYDCLNNLFLPLKCKRVGRDDFTTSNPLMLFTENNFVYDVHSQLIEITPSKKNYITIRGHIYSFDNRKEADRYYLKERDILFVGSIFIVIDQI
jgi:hypothetical protein